MKGRWTDLWKEKRVGWIQKNLVPESRGLVIEEGVEMGTDSGASSSQIGEDTMGWRGVGFDSGTPGV